MIKQLSVFIENTPGRLAKIMTKIADAGINIYALSIADTADFGILRLIVDDAESAKEIMKAQGLMVKMTDVLAVALEHRSGGLAAVLNELAQVGASIEYMYASTSRAQGHDAMAIISLSNQPEVLENLKNTGIRMLSKEDIAHA